MPRLRARMHLCAAVMLAAAGCAGSGLAQPGAQTADRASDWTAGDGAGPVTTRELVESGGLSGLMVSPDGQYAVVRLDRQSLAENQTALTWRVIRLSDGLDVAAIDGGAARLNVNGGLAGEAPQWSPDSRSIYLRRLQGEEMQLWRVGRDGTGLRQVTHDDADIVAFIVDGDGAVHYAVGPATRAAIKAAEQAEYDTGVLLDPTFIVGYAATHNFPVNGRMATYRRAPDARYFGRATLLGETPLQVKTLRADFSGASPSTAPVVARFEALWRETGGGFLDVDPGLHDRAHHAPSARSASLHTSASDGEQHARTRSHTVLSWRGNSSEGRAGGGRAGEDAADQGGDCEAVICADADHLTIVGWTANGSDLIFQSATFGTTRLNRWNVASGSVDTLFETEGVLGSAASGTSGACQPSGRQVICILAGPALPPRLIGIDLDTGAMQVLLDPNPHLIAERLGRIEKLTLTDRFGSTALAYLVLPQGYAHQTRLPLVITSYTCSGFLLGGSGQDVPEHVLAGQGIAAACVDLGGYNVRRAEGFSLSRRDADLSSLDFFEDAVRRLDVDRVVDPRRVMLTGFSGSSTSTTLAIAQSRTFAAAAVTTNGSPDAIACYLAAHYRSCEAWAREENQGLPYDSRSGILAASPAWHADRITAPLLMQLPETEYTGMMQLYGAMLDYGRAVEMVIYADAYHYKNQPRQRLAVYDRHVAWADFWLRGRVSEKRGDEAQTERWEGMRERQCALFSGDNALGDPPWFCAP